jgi:hypothetical protein
MSKRFVTKNIKTVNNNYIDGVLENTEVIHQIQSYTIVKKQFYKLIKENLGVGMWLNIANTNVLIYFELVKLATPDDVIILNKYIKEQLMEKYNISHQRLYSILKLLTTENAIKKKSVGTYTLNPIYLTSGYDKDIIRKKDKYQNN